MCFLNSMGKTDRASHKHLQDVKCKGLCLPNFFDILDHSATIFHLKIKEAIQWEHSS